jgi:mono/diheme cytochrome c family protein
MPNKVRVMSGVLGLAGVFAFAIVAADTATSEDSAWLPLPAPSAQPDLANPLEQRGREVFQQRCLACHGEVPDDVLGALFVPAMPGTQALEARYRGALPAVLDERTDLSAEYVEAVVRNGLNSMPFFRPTELSADDLEALTAYLTRMRD